MRDVGDKASNLLGEDSLLRGYPASPGGQRYLMWENATLIDFHKGNELTPAADFLEAIRVE